MTEDQKQRAEAIIKKWGRQWENWEKAEVGAEAIKLLKEIINDSN